MKSPIPSMTREIICRSSEFLNGLLSGIDIQFIQDIEGGNEDVILAHSDTSESNNPIATVISKQRRDRLLRLNSQGMLPKHSLKIFVRRQPPGKLLDKPKIFSKPQLFQEIAEKKLRVEMATMEQLAKDIASGLKTLDLESTRLTADEILDLIFWQWNPDRCIERPPYNPENVRGHLLFTDVGINEKGFSISDIHCRLISLKLLPDETISSMARVLRDLPFDSRLFLSVSVPDQQKVSHFQELKGKVLLNDKESKEREGLLSDVQMLSWIESQLGESEKVPELSDRLSLIDFLEDTITWKENPVREDFIATIERLISKDTEHVSKVDKRNFVGDKIELYTILYLEEPERAENLLNKAKNTHLEEILNYAKKRLSLNKKMLENSR